MAENDILINLSARDNLSPVLQQVAHAFDQLRATYDAAVREMATTGGVVASFEAVDRALKSMAGSVANTFRGLGEEQAALATQLLHHESQVQSEITKNLEREAANRARIMERLSDQEIEAASRADAQVLEARQRQRAQFEALDRQVRAQAANKQMADARAAAAEERRLEDQRIQNRIDFLARVRAAQGRMREGEDERFYQAEMARGREQAKAFEENQKQQERAEQAKRKSAEDTFLLVQEINNQSVRLEKQRADAIIAEQERISNARQQAVSRFGSALGIGPG